MSLRFRAAGDDPLYESVSAGRKAVGMEHWLAAVYDISTPSSLSAALPGDAGASDGRIQSSAAGMIADCYDTASNSATRIER